MGSRYRLCNLEKGNDDNKKIKEEVNFSDNYYDNNEKENYSYIDYGKNKVYGGLKYFYDRCEIL